MQQHPVMRYAALLSDGRARCYVGLSARWFLSFCVPNPSLCVTAAVHLASCRGVCGTPPTWPPQREIEDHGHRRLRLALPSWLSLWYAPKQLPQRVVWACCPLFFSLFRHMLGLGSGKRPTHCEQVASTTHHTKSRITHQR